MEKIKNLLLNHGLKLMVVAALAFSASACDEDDDKKSSKKSNAVESALEEGTWQVTYFFDNDTDETTDFETYVFTFSENGDVQAVSGDDVIDGTWSTRASGDDGAKLVLDFNGGFDAFNEISDDWHVSQNTETKIELMDDTDDMDDVEYLTLTKI